MHNIFTITLLSALITQNVICKELSIARTAIDLTLSKKVTKKRDGLPSCYTGGGESEWGEREIADKWTARYCSSVLEFGGGAGSVSTIIQKHLRNKKNHVVIEPLDTKNPMMGGYNKLLQNKNACSEQYTTIDHILKKGEQKNILMLVENPFDCIVADCEGCLNSEYDKNPELFKAVKMIQVERDDRYPLNSVTGGKYEILFGKLGLKKIDTGYGCGGKCYSEVWAKDLDI